MNRRGVILALPAQAKFGPDTPLNQGPGSGQARCSSAATLRGVVAADFRPSGARRPRLDKLHIGMSPQLSIDLLGTPRLHVGDVAHLLSARDAALLALLVVGEGLPRARAGALLWPDSDPKHAGLSLRQRIFRLNRLAGRELVAGQGTIALTPGVTCDLQRFAVAIDSDPTFGPGELLGAMVFDEHEELSRWLQAARSHWRDLRRAHLTERAERAEAAGELARALTYAERVATEAPALEHAHRRVIRLHYRRGDRAAAVQAYDRCRNALQRECGIGPGPETEALAALVIAQEPIAEPPQRSPLPVVLQRPPRLIGRAPDRARLIDAMERGHALWLTGEPGIGKTRLLTELAKDRPEAVYVDARPGDPQLPWALAARVADALVRRLPGADVAACPDWVSAGLVALVPALGSAHRRPLLPLRLAQALRWLVDRVSPELLIDDLQFGDPPSVEMLLGLASDGAGRAWVLASRAGEEPVAALDWLGRAEGPVHARVVHTHCLAPLQPADVALLLDSLDLPGLTAHAWSERVWQHAGGNPLFILATLADWLEAGLASTAAPSSMLPSPAAVGRLIERRLAGLSAQALQLAQLAALADPDFDPELAARILGTHVLALAPAWRTLDQAHVWRDGVFLHDLVREAARRTLPDALAMVLHRQLAPLLAARGVADARVAAHWELAKCWPEAGSAALQAAAHALAAGQRHAEAAWLERALVAFERAGLPDSAYLAARQRLGALVQVNSGESLRAAMADLERRGRGRADAWRGDIALAEAQIVFGEFEAVEARMPAATLAAEHAGDLELACLGARRLAVARVNSGRAAAACAALEAWVPALGHDLPLQARAEFLCEFGTVLERADRRREGEQRLREGIDAARKAGDLSTAATALVNLGINRVYWGDSDAAAAAAAEGIELRQRLDDWGGLADGFEMTYGAMQRDQGRYAEAIERLERATAAFAAAGNALWTCNARSHLALLWLQLGQLARARQVLVTPGEGVPSFLRARQSCIEGQWLEAMGKNGQPLIADALSLLGADGRRDIRLAIGLERLRGLPPQDAAQRSRSIQEEAERHELMGLALGARAGRLDAAWRGGRSAAHVSEALSVASDAERLLPSGSYRPALWLAAARVLLAAGEPVSAHSILQQAARWIADCAAQLPPHFRDGFRRRNAVNVEIERLSRPQSR